jgi:hypothetical protein
MPVRLPEVGSVWEGRTKPGYPFTRRRVVELLDTGIRWEPVGLASSNTKPVITVSTWWTWAKRVVQK